MPFEKKQKTVLHQCFEHSTRTGAENQPFMGIKMQNKYIYKRIFKVYFLKRTSNTKRFPLLPPKQKHRPTIRLTVRTTN